MLYNSIKLIFHYNSICLVACVLKRLNLREDRRFLRLPIEQRNRRSENNRDTACIGACRGLSRKSSPMLCNQTLRDTDCTPWDTRVRGRTGFLRTVELFWLTERTGIDDSH